jgi:hypothetical protein
VEAFVPYYWAAVLGLSGAPLAGFEGLDGLARERSADTRRNLGRLDIAVVRVLSGMLIDTVSCTVCGARLGRHLDARATHRPFDSPSIVVITRYRGWRRHRHTANVDERGGELCFGPFHLT